MPTIKRCSEAIWIEKKGYWQIKVQKDGVRKAFTSSVPGRKGKHEAENKADDWLEKGTQDMRFDKAWGIYMDNVRKTTGTANTANKDSIGRMWLLPKLGNRRLSTITQHNMQSCIDDAACAGKSKRLCVNIRASITSFCHFARTCRWEIEQPFDLSIPRNAPTKNRAILQPSDLQLLFSCDTVTRYGKESQAFFIHAWRFIVILGLRRGELCGLMRSDLENNILHINRSFNNLGEETPGKNENARRYIALPTIAQKILRDQQEMQKQRGIISPWIFPDESGERLDSNHLYKAWAAYRKCHGIEVSLHELRHTFVSVVKSDMPIALLKSMVGHSTSMDTFGVYGHELEGDLQQTANIVDNVFSRLIDLK